MFSQDQSTESKAEKHNKLLFMLEFSDSSTKDFLVYDQLNLLTPYSQKTTPFRTRVKFDF